jgi:chemotaxis family two-component system response regulator Rcp1
MSVAKFVVLIAEDNPTDVMIMREALEGAKVMVELHAVADGVEALEFLRRMGTYKAMPRPDLILLDLNMPRKNGHEVLAEVKGNLEFREIPVVMLTTSQAEDDVAKAYANHVNCYIRKPVDFENFVQVVRSIEQFWFTVVTLPKER